MKISKKEKAVNRRNIIEAAVVLFTEDGYQQVSMKRIAKHAGIGDATIYKYFSSKEKLLIGYYETRAQDAIADVDQIEDWKDYELQEKIQVLIDSYLQHLLPDREFVIASFAMIYHSPMFLFSDVAPIRKEFHNAIQAILDDAWAREEIPTFPFQGVLPDLICEYIIGVLHFWIKDESDEFFETTQLIDLSLNLGITLLKSGLINQATDFMGFMLKSQMLRMLHPSHGMFQQYLKLKDILK